MKINIRAIMNRKGLDRIGFRTEEPTVQGMFGRHLIGSLGGRNDTDGGDCTDCFDEDEQVRRRCGAKRRTVSRFRILLFVIAGEVVVPVLVGRAEGSQSAPEPRGTGAGVYLAACSGCHGMDGRGLSQSRVGFDTPLPDFTDCSFATREPDFDWVAVASEGGPARGFSKMMPAFGGALTFQELELAVSHIHTFCTDENWPRGDLNLPRALVTEKAYPEDETVLTSGFPVEGAGSFLNEIVFEKRFGARNQFELAVPFGWRENEQWTGGIGDIGVGVKRVLADSLKSGSIFSVTGEVKLPTGNKEKDFGKGTVLFEPFVSFGQVLPSEFFLHAQGGVELSADTKKSEHEGFWRVVLGRSFTQGDFGRTWSPMVELLGAREFVSGAKIGWDVLPQFQVSLNTRQHIMLNVGVRLPVTDGDTRQTTVLFYLFWDWFDGSLLEGW